MKCELTAEGLLRIMPESSVEQFALSHWKKTKIEIIERDHTVMMLDNCKALSEMIARDRAQYEAYLKAREESNAQAGAADNGGSST